MSHKHEHLVRAIFSDPPNHNIHWRDVESLLKHFGADIENLPGSRQRVRLNGMEGILHRPHNGHTLDRQGVKHLREFMARARLTPAAVENA